jgi:hypothetical protein
MILVLSTERACKEMLHLMTSGDHYKQFRSELMTSFPNHSWTIAIFEGSPIKGLYSWCPDCIVASTHIRLFEKHQDRIRLVKFQVGTRKEWEDKTYLNPFKTKFPYLSDVPTAILFMRTLDVYRIVAPQESDLEVMCDRTKIYEKQIRLGEWHPLLRKQKTHCKEKRN